MFLYKCDGVIAITAHATHARCNTVIPTPIPIQFAIFILIAVKKYLAIIFMQFSFQVPLGVLQDKTVQFTCRIAMSTSDSITDQPSSTKYLKIPNFIADTAWLSPVPVLAYAGWLSILESFILLCRVVVHCCLFCYAGWLSILAYFVTRTTCCLFCYVGWLSILALFCYTHYHDMQRFTSYSNLMKILCQRVRQRNGMQSEDRSLKMLYTSQNYDEAKGNANRG